VFGSVQATRTTPASIDDRAPSSSGRAGAFEEELGIFADDHSLVARLLFLEVGPDRADVGEFEPRMVVKKGDGDPELVVAKFPSEPLAPLMGKLVAPPRPSGLCQREGVPMGVGGPVELAAMRPGQPDRKPTIAMLFAPPGVLEPV